MSISFINFLPPTTAFHFHSDGCGHYPSGHALALLCSRLGVGSIHHPVPGTVRNILGVCIQHTNPQEMGNSETGAGWEISLGVWALSPKMAIVSHAHLSHPSEFRPLLLQTKMSSTTNVNIIHKLPPSHHCIPFSFGWMWPLSQWSCLGIALFSTWCGIHPPSSTWNSPQYLGCVHTTHQPTYTQGIAVRESWRPLIMWCTTRENVIETMRNYAHAIFWLSSRHSGISNKQFGTTCLLAFVKPFFNRIAKNTLLRVSPFKSTTRCHFISHSMNRS